MVVKRFEILNKRKFEKELSNCDVIIIGESSNLDLFSVMREYEIINTAKPKAIGDVSIEHGRRVDPQKILREIIGSEKYLNQKRWKSTQE